MTCPGENRFGNCHYYCYINIVGQATLPLFISSSGEVCVNYDTDILICTLQTRICQHKPPDWPDWLFTVKVNKDLDILNIYLQLLNQWLSKLVCLMGLHIHFRIKKGKTAPATSLCTVCSRLFSNPTSLYRQHWTNSTELHSVLCTVCHLYCVILHHLEEWRK